MRRARLEMHPQHPMYDWGDHRPVVQQQQRWMVPLVALCAAALLSLLAVVTLCRRCARRRGSRAAKARIVAVGESAQGLEAGDQGSEAASVWELDEDEEVEKLETAEAAKDICHESLVPAVEEMTKVQELRALLLAEGGPSAAEGIEGGARWLEDCELLRYVRARKTLGESQKLFREAMTWRLKLEPTWGSTISEGSYGAANSDYLAGTTQPPAWWTFLKAHLPQAFCGNDKNGLPVFYSAVGHADLQGCEREVGLENLQKYCVMHNDSFLDLARAASSRSGGPVFHGGVVIVDLQGLSWRHMQEARTFNKLAEVVKVLHPERQRRCYIVRAPRAFTMVWRLVRPIIDPRTAARMTILGARDSTKPLLEELGPESVPAFLGGTGALPPPCEDLVPVGAFKKHQEEVGVAAS